VYNRHTALDCVSASKHQLALATAARDGAITVFNIEKQSMLASRSIDTREDGAPVQLLFNDTGHPPLLFYTSAFGVTVGWVIVVSSLFKTEDNVHMGKLLKNIFIKIGVLKVTEETS
jgi:hypothetical protein